MKKLMHQLEEAIIGLLLVSTALLVFLEVVMRFFFDTGLLWAQELTLNLCAWMVLFGASWGVRVGAHIGVDAFIKILPGVWQQRLTLLAVALCLIYCALYFYGTWIYLSKLKMIGIEMEDLPIPRWQAMSILPIGLALLFLRFLNVGIMVWRGQMSGFALADEAKESMHLIDNDPNQKA
ncbi:TRAP transporter small permease [Aeromonas enteropelogenes]|uniref:TRAP transporter small permease n=1 Tax=Aeromonas enteropelogenes TaxID=29489 RepID=UPI000F5432AC|nr:TRAP transporter small permease [Aeromonas enteropelogenes]RQM59906.1 TRAP transporter small permease [Aeromonas enteropelogenes]